VMVLRDPAFPTLLQNMKQLPARRTSMMGGDQEEVSSAEGESHHTLPVAQIHTS